MLRETASGQSLTPANALAILDVYSAVRLLSDLTASLPLIPYRRTPTGRVRVDDSRTAQLLHRPMPGVTQPAFLGQAMAHLLLWGSAYVGKHRNPAGEIEMLSLLDPGRVEVERKSGELQFTYHRVDGPPTKHTTRDICHVRALLSIDGLTGLSPIGMCREGVALSNALIEHSARFFSNGAAPAGILKVPNGPIVQDQIDNLKRDWEARHKGSPHKIAILAGDIDFAPITMPMEDAQFIQQRRLSSTEVCRAFRIPAWALDADSGSSMTYANVTEQARSLVMFSLRPWLVCIESALSADEDFFRPNEYGEFLMDGALRASHSERSEIYTRALDPVTGWMSREEVRELENLPRESAPIPVPSQNGAKTQPAGVT